MLENLFNDENRLLYTIENLTEMMDELERKIHFENPIDLEDIKVILYYWQGLLKVEMEKNRVFLKNQATNLIAFFEQNNQKQIRQLIITTTDKLNELRERKAMLLTDATVVQIPKIKCKIPTAFLAHMAHIRPRPKDMSPQDVIVEPNRPFFEGPSF